MNFPLPIEFSNDPVNRKPIFKPKGVCFDSFGRAIVTDPDNHQVLRVTRLNDEPQGAQAESYISPYAMEPLISKQEEGLLIHLNYPKQVAFSPDNKLWVFCEQKIVILDY